MLFTQGRVDGEMGKGAISLLVHRLRLGCHHVNLQWAVAMIHGVWLHVACGRVVCSM